MIRTDPETGEITYPIGQQPTDALARGCVFGRSNVRCPRPREEALRETLEDWTAADADADADAVPGNLEVDGLFKDPTAQTMADVMANDVLTPDLSDAFDLAMAASCEGKPEASAAPAQETQPQPRAGCRREEYRSQDGTSAGFRFVCGSGDQRLMDSVNEALDRASHQVGGDLDADPLRLFGPAVRDERPGRRDRASASAGGPVLDAERWTTDRGRAEGCPTAGNRVFVSDQPAPVVEAPATSDDDCRREERRSADRTSVSFQVVCGADSEARRAVEAFPDRPN